MKKPPFLFYIIFLISGCFLACKEENRLPATVQSIKKSGQLVTVEYTLSKIVKASDDKTWYKVGNRKILMSMEAHLKAGINLQAINENNFVADGSTLTVELPSAQIFSLSIPPEKIKMEYQEIDILRQDFSAAERENLLAQAELEIRKLADSLNILEKAEENAVIYVEKLLQQSGYENVTIRFEKR